MQEPLKKHLRAPGQMKPLFGPAAIVFDSTDTGSWRILRPEYEHWECVNCRTCQWYCPVDAISINGREDKYIEFNLDYCKGCGICANVCPRQCIRMEKEGEK